MMMDSHSPDCLTFAQALHVLFDQEAPWARKRVGLHHSHPGTRYHLCPISGSHLPLFRLSVAPSQESKGRTWVAQEPDGLLVEAAGGLELQLGMAPDPTPFAGPKCFAGNGTGTAAKALVHQGKILRYCKENYGVKKISDRICTSCDCLNQLAVSGMWPYGLSPSSSSKASRCLVRHFDVVLLAAPPFS